MKNRWLIFLIQKTWINRMIGDLRVIKILFDLLIINKTKLNHSIFL
jgi:hypothetical protein